jgi:hypothetical protein
VALGLKERSPPSLPAVPLANVGGSAAREGLWACGAARRVEELCSLWQRPHKAHRPCDDDCTQRRAGPPTNQPGTTVTEAASRFIGSMGVKATAVVP